MPADPLTLSVTAGALRPHRRGPHPRRAAGGTRRRRAGLGVRQRLPAAGGGAPPTPRAATRHPHCRTGRRSARWRLPEDLGRSYAGVSGDVNPIHLHALSAKAMGFPRQIAHGMWTYARTLAALGRTSLGPSSSSVWFTAPVFLPSTVELVVDRDADTRDRRAAVGQGRPPGAPRAHPRAAEEARPSADC